jgi:hypothetical protein
METKKKKRQPGASSPRGVFDKIEECRFFLERMAAYEHVREIKSALFCLSAFLSAFRSAGYRLLGVVSALRGGHAKGILERQLDSHPRIVFLFEVRDVEVHGDGATIWPRFRIVDRRTGGPGPLELHFFPTIANNIRIIGLRLEGQHTDQDLAEFCRDALDDLENLIGKTRL